MPKLFTGFNFRGKRPRTEVIVVWGNPGDPEKRVRATVTPEPYKADHRRLDLRAAL